MDGSLRNYNRRFANVWFFFRTSIFKVVTTLGNISRPICKESLESTSKFKFVEKCGKVAALTEEFITQTYWEWSVPRILKFGTAWNVMVSFTVEEISPIPIGQYVGSAPKPVWMLRR